MYFRAFYGSQKKQRLFPYTELNNFFCNQDVFCLLRGTDWIFKYTSG